MLPLLMLPQRVVFKSITSAKVVLRNNRKSLTYTYRNYSSSTKGMDSQEDYKFKLPERYSGQGKSVWVEYVQLAAEHKPLNLGQGFPDYPPPSHVTKALSDVANGDCMFNQYTRGFGHPRLVNALSKLYSKLTSVEINPMTDVIITVGAYEALYVTIQGHVEPGNEVIIIEPFYDCYEPMVKAAGGVCRFIALKPTTITGHVTSEVWVLDKEKLKSLFNNKTKMIIINSPHNPTGKVFSREELTFIADLCKEHDVLCVSDEVYEWIVYEPYEHIRIATLPDMWDRTITIGSAGKTFSVTGWKIGWAYGPAKLLANLQMVHQNCVYTCSTPLQEACARAFETEIELLGSEDSYFTSLAKELVAKRDFMAKFLRDTGMTPVIPQGGYFMLADWSVLCLKIDLKGEKDSKMDYKFTKWMTKNVGLQGIPPSAFYSRKHKTLGEPYVRYCFIKKDENLKEAADILKKWSKTLTRRNV